PPNASAEGQGIGKALAGMVASAEGVMRSASSPPSTTIVIPSYGSEAAGQETGEERESLQHTEPKSGMASEVQQEQEMLDDALNKLKQSIQEDPLVRDLQDSILFEVTEDGLMIQLLDYQKREMFEPGTDILTRRAIRLLALISGILVELPNNISITGHTDSGIQPNATPDYTNWELSADRAAASRRWMEANGFPGNRLVRVEGKADTELLNPRNPEDERNRRISILLLREHSANPEVSEEMTPGSNNSAPPESMAGPAPALDSSGVAPPPLPKF
ncbi:MAG: OmpA family protein, partial [Alphaproteobacteria bacterium]|nr:OmpA family protein [Alphaproteobacteria bacterium]